MPSSTSGSSSDSERRGRSHKRDHGDRKQKRSKRSREDGAARRAASSSSSGSSSASSGSSRSTSRSRSRKHRKHDGVSSPKDAKKSKSRSKSKSRKEKKERKDKKDKKSKKDKKGKKDKKERKGKKDKKDRRGRRGDGSDADIDPDVADFRASRGMAPRGVPASAAAAAGDVDAATEAIAKGAKAKEILASREYKEAQQQLHNKRQGPGDLGSGSFHDMLQQRKAVRLHKSLVASKRLGEKVARVEAAESQKVDDILASLGLSRDTLATGVVPIPQRQ